MSFENFSSSQKKEAGPIKKGVALKSFIAITNGLLNRSAKFEKEQGFLISVIDKAKESYKALEALEYQIDPSGNLSKEIEEKIESDLGKLTQWLKKM
jgi:hypothetical protein